MAAVFKVFGKAGTGYEAPSLSGEGTLAELNVGLGLPEDQPSVIVMACRFMDGIVALQGEYHEKIQAAKANYAPKQ